MDFEESGRRFIPRRPGKGATPDIFGRPRLKPAEQLVPLTSVKLDALTAIRPTRPPGVSRFLPGANIYLAKPSFGVRARATAIYKRKRRLTLDVW